MKRRTLKFIACAAMMALTLSVTACGSSDDGIRPATPSVTGTRGTTDVTKSETEDVTEPETEDVTEPEVEDVAEPEVEDEADAGDEDSYETLEEIFADPEIKDAFDEIFSVLEGSGLSLSLEVIDNNFIMTLKVEDSSLLGDGVEEALMATLEQQEDQYKAYAAQFDELLGEAGATTVTVRYTGPDDGVLAEQSYKAD